VTFGEIARYSVDRLDGLGPTARVRTLHAGKTWDEAQRLLALEEKNLEAEPGYRPNVMSRPVIGIRIENCEEARAAK
jgi:hypothetical protein